MLIKGSLELQSGVEEKVSRMVATVEEPVLRGEPEGRTATEESSVSTRSKLAFTLSIKP